MAYSQLGYPYSTTPQFLMTSSSLASCLEPGGRPLVEPLPPPSSSHSVYESRVLRSPRHDHLTPVVPAVVPAGISGVYSGAYAKGQGYYSACSSDATAALYSRGPLDSKGGTTSATSQTPTYYPYEYTFGQYPYDRYGYSCSDGAARRKNATRETTSTLKAWLQEHQKNPYPTKGEKIMLAIITRMTLTQVSTWFANARRRLKKENKVTWSPRACKSADDRACDDDSDGAEEPTKPLSDQQCTDLHSDMEDFDLLESDGSDCEPKPQFMPEDDTANITSTDISHGHLTCNQGPLHRKERLSPDCPELTPVQHPANAFCPGLDLQGTETKPKIWSIAHTAVSLQAEFPPCMLSAGPSSPAYPSEVGVTAADRQQDSPVATLREWVDGVFHNPLFQHRSLMQALPKPATAWKGLNGAPMDSRTPGHSFEHIRPTSAL